MRIIAIISLVLALCAIGTSLRALEYDGHSFLLGSKHFGANTDFNELNPGVFLRYTNDWINVRPGVIYNSNEKFSPIVTFSSDLTTISVRDFNIATFGGVGYYHEEGKNSHISIANTGWIPIAGIEITHDEYPIFVNIIPGDMSEKIEGDGYRLLISFGLSF